MMDNEIKLSLEQPAPAMPTLTLEPEAEPEPQAPAQEEVQVTTLDESVLTPEERKVVDDFSQKIDLQNSKIGRASCRERV